jgi:cyclopropane-fatty-acyl-phospholipid synthase
MPHTHRTTKDQTRELIAHHYDLSNDLFRLFLDASLSYSSAMFEGDLDLDLMSAQHRKIDRLLDVARVGEGTRVLEIGTGWGELAIRAAARGATVRSVTLSSEQQALARQRIEDAGCSDRVQVDLCDYRDVDGEYDAVLSVEMIEAVGHEFWPEYFSTIDCLLAPGGRAGIQAILMPHDRMLATRGSFTWINKYIFPGGFLPSVEAIDEVTTEHTALRVTDRLAFGHDYAETLRRWDETFLARADEVLRLGFDNTFLRMWHFYLCYSRAGFASGYLDVEQVLLERADS